MDLRESSTRSGRRHPWETARADFLIRLLRRHDRATAARILDVGSGDAWFASGLLGRLEGVREIVCVDAEYDAGRLAALELPPGVVGQRELPEGRFDLVLALDVAEHVEDDLGFMRALRERAAESGTLLFTVPAWQGLFSGHDRALLHHRRYSHDTARALLTTSGFRIEEDGGFFHTLLAPRALAVALEKLGLSGGDASEGSWGRGPGITRAIGAVLAAENALTHALGARGMALPGLGYYAIARPA